MCALIDYEQYHSKGRTAEFADVFERARVRTIRAAVAKWGITTAGTFLDVGAGEGRYLPVWQSLFPNATLIAAELSATAVERSAKRYPFAKHLMAPAECLPFDNASVDALASIEVLEHVLSPIKMLSECYRVLRPGGWALFSTLCANRHWGWWLNYFAGTIGQGLGGGITLVGDDPTHLRIYRSRELAVLLGAVGIEQEQHFFGGHGFLHIGQTLERSVKSRLNIERRSRQLAKAFDRAYDGIAQLDWWLLRRVPAATTMIYLVRKPTPPPW